MSIDDKTLVDVLPIGGYCLKCPTSEVYKSALERRQNGSVSERRKAEENLRAQTSNCIAHCKAYDLFTWLYDLENQAISPEDH